MANSTLRASALLILDEVLDPVSLDELNAILIARFSVGASPDELSELLASDELRYSAGMTSPILLPALKVPGGGAAPEFATRSDWSIKMRLVGQKLEAARRVSMIRWMCDQLGIAKQERSTSFSLLEQKVLSMAAAQIPDEIISGYRAEEGVDSSPLAAIRNAAEDYSHELRIEVSNLVDSAVGEISSRSENEILFGSGPRLG